MIYVPFASQIHIPFDKTDGHITVSDGTGEIFAKYRINAKVEDVPQDRLIYAFAYRMNDKNMQAQLKQKPIQGFIMTKYGETLSPNSRTSEWHFVPVGKRGQLVLSKAIQIYGRAYADTEDEAIAGFNALVQMRINKLTNLITESINEMIPAATAD